MFEKVKFDQLQLFRERLSYNRIKAYATMSKVVIGNGDFTVACVNLKVFQRGGRKHYKHVYSCFLLPFNLNQAKPKAYYP